MTNHFLRWALCTGFIVLLCACAAPQTLQVNVSDEATKAEARRQTEIAIAEQVAESKRLHSVYHVLATKSVSFCGQDVGVRLGGTITTKPKGVDGDVMSSLYGIKEDPTVLIVVAGGPLDLAGIKTGDVITQINDIAMTPDVLKEGKFLEKMQGGTDATFIVNRGGVRITTTVKPVIGCRYATTLNNQQIINAFADGKSIQMTRGMLSFAKNDNELALVLSHEMAHNTMKHIEAKQRNAAGGLLLDLLVIAASRGQTSNTNFAQSAANAYSKEFEAEADYVGLYIMANAEFPIDDAPMFWRRMAVANPSNIKTNHSASHPSTAYRMVALEETVKEIKQKIASKQPLVPNMKDRKSSPDGTN